MTAEPQFARAAVLAEIDRIHALQRAKRATALPPATTERIAKIRALHDALFARRDEIRQALWDDYKKPAAEVDLSEIYPVVSEARHARRHLKGWMKPHRVATPLALLGSRSCIVYEPKGVVLIISPWNFPINLTFGPLVSAIAAGNSAILKPSEMTPHASACMKSIVSDLFDESEVAVIEGDGSVAAALLEKKFDHIFFTGSPRVGRIVMKAAAEHLTSVTLELGGKSPVIVDKTANLDEAAKKIAWGKFFNAGQICIAPDYLLVDESIRPQLSAKLREAIDAMGSDGARGVLVNDAHAARMRSLIDDAAASGAEVFASGVAKERDVPPTILSNVRTDSAVMQQEIFGPILPIIGYRNIEEALQIIREREKPLVLYVFSQSKRFIRDVLARTTAGGTAINDTLIHFYQVNLPFGGTGESGIGNSHGFYGFEAFSNMRGVLSQPTRFSAVQWMYPPYTKLKQKLIDLTLKYF